MQRRPGFVADVEAKIRNEIAEAEKKRNLFRNMPPRMREELKDIVHFRNDPKYGGAQKTVKYLSHGTLERKGRGCLLFN
jgi:hypothetical protein